MPEDISTAATTETNVAEIAPASTDVGAATPETPSATALESTETSLIDDIKTERERLEAEGKPKTEAKEEKPEAKVEEAKKETDDEKEPEGLTEAEKNRAAWIKKQRDNQLAESAKLADERKALDAEKAELEKARSEIAAKPKTEEAKETPKVDQPVAALEHYKEVALKSYEDGENENELALKTGLDALAKDVQTILTARDAEIVSLKSEVKRLMDLAAPYIPDEKGVTQAEVQHAGNMLKEAAVSASEALMGEFGPDSGLQLDPVNLMAAWNELCQGFMKLGEIKSDAWLTKDAILHCWRHANKGEIEKAKAKPEIPQEEKIVPPPVRKEEGKPAQPTSYEEMTEREKLIYDMKQEEAVLNGKR